MLRLTIPPLLTISSLCPSLFFPRNMDDRSPAGQPRSFQRSVISILVIGAGIYGIAVWMSGSIRIGSWFAGGLVVCLILLAVLSRLLLFGLRQVMKRWASAFSPIVRQGIAN